MASVRNLVAAVGGLAVAFVLVMLLSIAARDPDLSKGEAQLALVAYDFPPDPVRMTRGSDLVVSNPGVVPHSIRVVAPNGTLVAEHPIAGGESWSVPLDREGEWTVACGEHPWMERTVTVVSANPLGRFLDRLAERFGG